MSLDADALATLWVAVTRAGGAVGFLPGAPEADIRAAAEAAAGAVAAGAEHVVVEADAGGLVGVAFVVPGSTAHTAHRATLARLMVRPDRQGTGAGTRLHDAAVDLAADLGIELLLLSARAGHGLERYYEARGWREVGRFPGGIAVGPDERRDEVWFARRPRPTGGSGTPDAGA